jgi:uncharacterized lipoprotein YajG
VNKLLALCAAMLLAGCGATTTIDEYRPNNQVMEINSEQSVVILPTVNLLTVSPAKWKVQI